LNLRRPQIRYGSPMSRKASSFSLAWPGRLPEVAGVVTEAVLTSVAMVSVDVTAVFVPSGATVAGENVHVEYAGKPEQLSDI
jgi:hypothetical protein